MTGGWIERWLDVGEEARKSDAIFVLAGGAARKAHGLELYRAGYAPRILLSVGRFEIRRLRELPLPTPLDLLSAAQAVPPPERHFFVEFNTSGVRCEQTRVGPFGTLSEILALTEWCQRNRQVESLLVISSGYHLLRVRMCCRAMLPLVRCVVVAAPQELPMPIGRFATEAVKLVVYRLALAARSLGAARTSGTL